MSLTGSNVQLLLTEDLSPHKISLLFLIQLYCKNKIPPQRIKSVLTVLIKLIDNRSYKEGDEKIIIPSLQDLIDSIKDIILENSGPNDENIDSDILQIQMIILKSLWDITSVKEMDNNLLNFYEILVPVETIYTIKESPYKKISSRSLLGSFIYKITSAFNVLKFDEIFLLYEALVGYREPSRQFYIDNGGIIESNVPLMQRKQENDVIDDNDELFYKALNNQLADMMDTVIPTTSESIIQQNTKYLAVPKHDLQILLDKQIQLLETNGTPTPMILKDIMTLMTSPNSNTSSIQNANFNNLPSYYYIRYLENLHQCDYNEAFKSLHQYFDYMVSSNSKYFYHFALISKASLHEFFGEDEQAIDSIEEAMSVAREHKDNSALTYILSWLFNFMKNKPQLWNKQTFFNNNDETQLLNFLIEKSKSVSLSLYSMSYNFETLQIMNNGGLMNQYLESIIKSTYIAINDQISTFTKSSETMAMVWSRIGNSQLSNVYTEISIDSTDDVRAKIPILIRLNFLKFYRGETEIGFKNLTKLKSEINQQEDYSLYKTVYIRWMILLIQLNLFKGKYRISNELVEILMDSEIKDLELKHELYLLNIETQISLKNYAKAMKLICDKLDGNLINQNVYLSIKLNLMKCKLFNQSENYSKSLILLIQQIQLGKKIGFTTIVVEGFALFISTLNNLGHYQDSYELMNQVMPMVISIGDKLVISQCYFELAKIHFKFYQDRKDQAEEDEENNEKLFHKVLQYLNLSILGFKDCCHLIELQSCFKFELEIAQFKQDQLLIEHAQDSIDKLKVRFLEEHNYGYA
ncbi:anaphase-promoting complex, subunit 5 [Scheffersomyces coipomensis]|uniref:anaphase-promoting complex, subunit 5 n=1 Tax=Scheffersomyces coipomensis TaxID=1788519 RepID=UPI00315C64F4